MSALLIMNFVKKRPEILHAIVGQVTLQFHKLFTKADWQVSARIFQAILITILATQKELFYLQIFQTILIAILAT